MKWTESEEKYTIYNYEFNTIKELSEQLGKSDHSIESKIKNLQSRGLLFRKKSFVDKGIYSKYWSIKDVNYLLTNYDKLSYKEMGEILNKKPKAVKDKIFRLRKQHILPIFEKNILYGQNMK